MEWVFPKNVDPGKIGAICGTNAHNNLVNVIVKNHFCWIILTPCGVFLSYDTLSAMFFVLVQYNILMHE